MAKKRDLKAGVGRISAGGFNALVRGTATPQEQAHTEAQVTPTAAPTAESKQYGRMCAVVNTTLQAKMQEIARSNNLTFKEVLEAAMEKAVQAYEAKFGEVVVTATAAKGNNKDLFND